MYDFLNKWECDEKVIKKYREIVIPSYLNQFKEEDKIIVLELLEQIEYYSEKSLDDLVLDYSYFLKDLHFNRFEDYFCVPQDDLIINHNTNKIIASIPIGHEIHCNALKTDLSLYQRIIVLDDYCGSAETIIGFLGELDKRLNDKLIAIYAPIIITEVGKTNLEKTAFKNIELQVVVFKENEASKLSNHCIFSIDHLNQFLTICQYLNIPSTYINGKNGVEDILATKKFTPNNSLGIMWYNEKLYRPLFRRNGIFNNLYYRYLSKEQLSIMREVIKIPRAAKGDDRKRAEISKRILKSKIGLLLRYNYSKKEIEYFLGVDDVDEMINALLKEGIIQKRDGNYTFYKNLNNYYKVNNLKELDDLEQIYFKQYVIENNIKKLIAH